MSETFEMAPGEEAFLSRSGLVNLKAVFACQTGQRLDKPGLEGWRQRWRLRLPDDVGGSRTVYLKRFEHPPARRQWQRWREGHALLSTAGVEWTNACRLAEAGVPAVRAVAFGQQMRGAWEVRSFVILAEVPGEALERCLSGMYRTASVDTAGDQSPGCPPRAAATRRELIDAAAGLVARLHSAGFVHRDLYLSHLFVAGRSLTLIDLQRVFRPRWRHRRWVVKDLAALHFSTPADEVARPLRLRFLCRYARCSGGSGAVRRLAAAIEAKARRMARRRPELAVGLSRQATTAKTAVPRPG